MATSRKKVEPEIRYIPVSEAVRTLPISVLIRQLYAVARQKRELEEVVRAEIEYENHVWGLLMSLFYQKIAKPIIILPFNNDMADKVKGTKEFPIHYIQTREGMRHIEKGMYIAHKSDKYRHPMAPEVFKRHYRPHPGYDVARHTADLFDSLKEEIRGLNLNDQAEAESRVFKLLEALDVDIKHLKNLYSFIEEEGKC